MFSIIILSEHSQRLFPTINELITDNDIFQKQNISPFVSVTGTMFAFFSILLLNFGDYSSYAKNENELNKGNLSLIINMILFSFFSVLLTLGADILLNSNEVEAERFLTNPTDIIGKIDNIYLTVISLFFIVIASLSTNLISNYIPSQNSLLNFLPKNLNLKSSGFFIIFFGLLISIFWLPVLSQIGILSFIDTIGCFFGPLFGLIICDYYLIKKGEIINKDIFSSKEESSYIYSNGWHYKAIYSVIIGFIFASSTIWNVNMQFLQTFSWLIGAFVSFVTYYLLAFR